MACLEIDGRSWSSTSACRSPRRRARDRPGPPDFEYIRDRRRRGRGRRAHPRPRGPLGALPYLLHEFARRAGLRHPVHLELLEGKLREPGSAHRGAPHARARRGADAGPFSMRFLRVTHSMPDGVAVAVDTRSARSCTPATSSWTRRRWTDDPRTCTASPRRPRRGVHLLLSDSTNAEEPGYVSSERTVGPVLLDIVAARPHGGGGLLLSHIHRIQQMVDAAEAGEPRGGLPRPVDDTAVAAAPPGYAPRRRRRRDPHRGPGRPRPGPRRGRLDRVAGRALSALSLMAAREHKWVKLDPDDTVVLSSSLMRERARDQRRSSTACTGPAPGCSTSRSGGPCERPRRRGRAPVHADPGRAAVVHPGPRRVPAPAASRRAGGRGGHRPRSRSSSSRTATWWRRGRARLESSRRVQGMTYVDGLGIGDVGDLVLRDRRKLAADGVVVVVLAVDAHRRARGGPDLVNRGFVFEETAGDILEEGRRASMMRRSRRRQDEVVDRHPPPRTSGGRWAGTSTRSPSASRSSSRWSWR